jgi:hypothetical protein
LLSRELDATIELANTDNMPLAQFLCCLWGMSEDSLMKQVLGQLSAFKDEIWLKRKMFKNPLDVEEDELSVPRGSRRDVVLGDKLALGEGCGADGARVKHPAQHMGSFRMFLLVAQRPRKIDPKDFNEDLMADMCRSRSTFCLWCATYQYHLMACG